VTVDAEKSDGKIGCERKVTMDAEKNDEKKIRRPYDGELLRS
jgi:hypothetical protein